MVRLYVSVPPGQPPRRKSLPKNSSRRAARLAANGSAGLLLTIAGPLRLVPVRGRAGGGAAPFRMAVRGRAGGMEPIGRIGPMGPIGPISPRGRRRPRPPGRLYRPPRRPIATRGGQDKMWFFGNRLQGADVMAELTHFDDRGAS